MDNNYLEKVTQCLLNNGHINVLEVKNIYQEGFWDNPVATYIEYVDPNNNIIKNPIEETLIDVDQMVSELPWVERPMLE